MRRGLMRRDENELPKAVLAERVEALRSAMQRSGLDGFILYTNLVQPSAVTYLTGFTPYWSDGLLLVMRSGAPVFATALSKRVAGWISSTNPLSEIVNSPKPGGAIGRRLAAEGCKRVAVLEMDRLPGGLFDEIADGAPALELTDGSALFASLRQKIDRSERGLIGRADAIALSALTQVDPDAAVDAGAAAGLIEKEARLQGAEEAYIAVAADLAADARMIRVSAPRPLADLFALRASIAYKGSWVRRTRTFAKDPSRRAAIARVDAWFERLATSITSGRTLEAQIAMRVGELGRAWVVSWMAESSVGSYPLQATATSNARDNAVLGGGAFFVLSLQLELDATRWLGAAPVFVDR